ncbi:Uma2 family endonuclease [Streptomyces sp. NPDC003077]|uniref:Uma2 family endonuclease n=1 Tax=Streptomyces sp. NPDC003077 TaxID=3154443 RepID=UPI0033BAAAA1
MSALTVEQVLGSGLDWEESVRTWEETDGPEGGKVEIIEGFVTVSPAPANHHNDIVDSVQRRIYSVVPDDWGVYGTQSVAVPTRRGLYVPDLVVIPKSVVQGEAGSYLPAAAAELVVEVTSPSNAGRDRTVKAAGYAQAGIPYYLLIDAWAPDNPMITLYGEPKGGVYQALQTVKSGEPVHLPAPFDVDIETASFPVERRE